MFRRLRILLTTLCVLTLVSVQVYAASPSSSTTIQVVTLANTPTDLVLDSANATDSAYPVSWSNGGNPNNTAYTLEISQDGTTWTTIQDKAIDDLEETVTGLQGNTTYDVRVSSYNQDTPPKTNGQYLTGQILTKPSKPATPTASVVDQTITVNWTNVDGTATKLLDGSDTEVPIIQGETSVVIPDMTPDTMFKYYVIHSNETGDSVPSDKVSVWTDAKPPSNLQTVSVTEDSIEVSIDPNGNPPTTEYQYRITQQDGTAVNQSGWVTDTTYTFTGLTPGEYIVYAKARNNPANPNQKETSEISLATGTIPPTPGLNTTPTETTITATLIPNDTSSNVEYRLALLDSDGNELESTGWAKEGEGWTVDGFEYTFSGLNPNQKYKVAAYARYIF